MVLSLDKDQTAVVMARANIEIYRLISELRGIPLRIDSDLRYEGFGSGLRNRFAITRHYRATNISGEPLPKEGFGLPPDVNVRAK